MKKKLEFEGVLYESYWEDGGLLIKEEGITFPSKCILEEVWGAIQKMVKGEKTEKEIEYFGKHKIKIDIEVVK